MVRPSSNATRVASSKHPIAAWITSHSPGVWCERLKRAQPQPRSLQPFEPVQGHQQRRISLHRSRDRAGVAEAVIPDRPRIALGRSAHSRVGALLTSGPVRGALRSRQLNSTAGLSPQTSHMRNPLSLLTHLPCTPSEHLTHVRIALTWPAFHLRMPRNVLQRDAPAGRWDGGRRERCRRWGHEPNRSWRGLRHEPNGSGLAVGRDRLEGWEGSAGEDSGPPGPYPRGLAEGPRGRGLLPSRLWAYPTPG